MPGPGLPRLPRRECAAYTRDFTAIVLSYEHKEGAYDVASRTISVEHKAVLLAYEVRSITILTGSG